MQSNRRVVLVSLVAAALIAGAVGISIAANRDDKPAATATPPSPGRVVQPGAPGQDSRTLSPDDLARLSAPPHSAADAEFMRKMITHHSQALELTALVAGRSPSQDIPQLAKRIEVSQKDEIAQLQQWLRDRGEALPEPHANHVGHGGLMPGMLDATDLTALAAANGPAFDKLFLQLMIRHHEGAITMVQQLYRDGGGVESAADRVAREVNADQSIEVRRMNDMLAKRA
ncbi:DUF305 domain-containing protein [Asanoa iriomotensis]|uniref:Lipoprotein n=1 Tax=Asanoa iriomotensis TaxID=234613 RepID=A0ABQ4C6H3_9ACTN|nr:DUF305 domain-containing protein [Asanoa iriomotensis]GIF58380.1 lipoprotein [Asanoa iriomotensis]